MHDNLKTAALDFHRLPRPGKIEISPTKPLATQRDLSLAYSPGVAFACEAIKEELKEVKKSREVQRKRRERLAVPRAAVVGYTNAGKSSLLNALTRASVLAEDKLFATPDPTTRRIAIGKGGSLPLPSGAQQQRRRVGRRAPIRAPVPGRRPACRRARDGAQDGSAGGRAKAWHPGVS